MSPYSTLPQRFIGLDVHRDYFVAAGVNAQQVPVFGPQRVMNHQLPAWIAKHLAKDDAVAKSIQALWIVGWRCGPHSE